MRRWRVWRVLPVLALLLLASMSPAMAAPTDVVISTSYPWVIAEKGKRVTFTLEIVNNGQSYRECDLRVAQGPADWQPLFKDAGYTIRRVMLGPGKSQDLEFQTQPPADAKAGDYEFVIEAVDPSGATLSSLRLQVTLSEQASKGLKLSAQYPNLRGRAGNAFSYKLDLQNNSTEDRTISLTAETPEGWEAVFKPAYETKQVSTVRVKAGESQGIDLELTPPQRVEAGEYAIRVQASAGGDRDELTLQAVVLGDYKISLTTPSGQLDAKAKLDAESTVALLVKNTGASTLQGITLSASKPEGWQVSFQPERIATLAPGQQQEVSAVLKPGSRALAGDYMLDITASTGQVSDSKGLRITVETPTSWGLAGVGTIVFVLGGLGLLFARLSRR